MIYQAWRSYTLHAFFIDGFDFTRADGRDANIYINNNIGVESKLPHARISVLNNSTVTTVTTPGTFYKANFLNTSSYKCKIIVTDNRFTYQPNDKADCKITLTCNVLSANTNGRIMTFFDWLSKLPAWYQMVLYPGLFLGIMLTLLYLIKRIFGRKNTLQIKDLIKLSSEENTSDKIKEKTEEEIKLLKVKNKIKRNKPCQ